MSGGMYDHHAEVQSGTENIDTPTDSFSERP